MKIIKYTLNQNGTIPNYIIDGGYLTKNNNSPAPQDYDFIGLATDDAPQPGYSSESELLQYAQDNNFVFIDLITNEKIPLQNVISSIWSKLG